MTDKEYFPKKLPDEYDNPLDNILYKIADKLCPPLYAMKFTPNSITFIGLIIGLVSIYYLYIGNKKYAFVFFWLCYFFDCLDGHYARKYNMETKFGDYFDHFRDISINGTIIAILIYKSKNKILTSSLIVFFGLLLSTHIGCQELHSEYIENNELLQKFIKLCKKKENIYYTRYFGFGTFMTILSILILYS